MLITGIIIAVIVVVVFGGILGILIAALKDNTPTEKGGGYYVDKQEFAKSRGAIGEQIVARALGETIVGEKYVINNLIFADRRGGSCQIDHICINRHGIWVIETKNYSGQIYGNENWREWTQVLSYGAVKNKHYNPVKQNATHIYSLSQQIRERDVFQNLVVFLSGADISNVQSSSICRVDEIPQRINADTGIVLSPVQMDRYYKRLMALKESNTISEEEHIQNVKTMQDNIRLGICPNCKSKLVLKSGKNGLFYGCARYPKCNFTKAL